MGLGFIQPMPTMAGSRTARRTRAEHCRQIDTPHTPPSARRGRGARPPAPLVGACGRRGAAHLRAPHLQRAGPPGPDGSPGARRRAPQPSRRLRGASDPRRQRTAHARRAHACCARRAARTHTHRTHTHAPSCSPARCTAPPKPPLKRFGSVIEWRPNNRTPPTTTTTRAPRDDWPSSPRRHEPPSMTRPGGSKRRKFLKFDTSTTSRQWPTLLHGEAAGAGAEAAARRTARRELRPRLPSPRGGSGARAVAGALPPARPSGRIPRARSPRPRRTGSERSAPEPRCLRAPPRERTPRPAVRAWQAWAPVRGARGRGCASSTDRVARPWVCVRACVRACVCADAARAPCQRTSRARCARCCFATAL